VFIIESQFNEQVLTARHLLSTFSSPRSGGKNRYNYGHRVEEGGMDKLLISVLTLSKRIYCMY